VDNKFVDLPAPAANRGSGTRADAHGRDHPLDNTFRSGHDYAATAENLPRVGAQMGAGMVVETKSPSFSGSPWKGLGKSPWPTTPSL
jgi:NADPH:quinone reductase